MKRLITCLFLVFGVGVFAQNLVMNPSFENNSGCPMGPSELSRANNWTDPFVISGNDTCSTSDYFHACNPLGPLGVGVPGNIMGNEPAHTGSGYAGLIIYEGMALTGCTPMFSSGWREYVQGQLTSPLTAGEQYCVSFWVSLADGVKWASNNFGVYLSPSQLAISCAGVSNSDLISQGITPQLTYSGAPIMITNGWTQLQFTYTAIGGEQYIVIGNFFDDSGTNYVCSDPNAFNPYSYYYIDDVSVIQDICCDPLFNNPSPLCVTDSPVSLTPNTIGGAWSGYGVNSSGIFDPSIAGPGTHPITYTLSCGSESVDIVVNDCSTLNICIDQNGDLVASGGDGNYNWETGVETPVTYPINSEQECIDCPSTTPQYIPIFGFYDGCSSNTCSDIDTVWTSVGVGTSYTPTTFPLMVTDGNGVFTVISSLADLSPCSTDPPCPQINVAISNQSDVSCNGANDGAATVSATGGSGPYTYTWTPGNITGATQTGLSPQTYTVSVEDANNCPGSVQVTIAEPSALSANAVATDACDNTGTASASPSGGTGPYTYSWSTGETTSSISNLAPGGYTVTVTDANSCTVQQTVTVSCTGCPTITVTESSHTDVTCNGANDGAATVVASGGNAPYSYTWNPGGMTGGSQTGLSPQTYTIVAEDTDGCTGTIQVVITESTVMTAITSSVDASCGINDGQATVNVSGGTGPYSYVWTPNVGTTASVSGLSAGVYSVVVTDANGCQLTETINVNNQNAPTATITSVSDETCLGAANGSATVSATGGSGNYTYAWSPSGGTSATATGLATGTYTVTVTDDSGCITSINVTIGAGLVITVTASVTDEDCGVANGAIDLSVSGGSGNYTYVWSSGEVTQDISGVSTGEYEVIVTDDTGCSTTETITVGVIGELFVTVVPPVATIDAGESVQLEASGGYTYTWTPEEGLSCTDCPDPIASPMVTTTYVVTAIDENGCAGDTTVVIFVENVCGEIFVPTIFSPNDDGNNDEHCVMGDCVQEFELSIYNRWGERVFISDNQANCWDGIFRGKPVQTGVYVYKLRVRLVDGTEVIDSGNINVVR